MNHSFLSNTYDTNNEMKITELENMNITDKIAAINIDTNISSKDLTIVESGEFLVDGMSNNNNNNNNNDIEIENQYYQEDKTTGDVKIVNVSFGPQHFDLLKVSQVFDCWFIILLISW
jgi:hypothetical protein